MRRRRDLGDGKAGSLDRVTLTSHGPDRRHRIDNTEELRAWVLDLAGQIRAARAIVDQPIPVSPVPGQYGPCGQRANCGQAGL